MEALKNFFSSKLGRTIIILIILLVLAYISYVMYQKSIYGGFTRSGLAKDLASKWSQYKINMIKTQDSNYSAQVTEEDKQGIIQWYVDNINFDAEVTENWVMGELKKLNIDFVKHPEILAVRTELIPHINLLG